MHEPTSPTPLTQKLGITPEACEALRDRALALFQERKLSDCLSVLRGLAAVGNVHPVDGLLMARCLSARGEHELAREAERSALELMAAMGLSLSEEG